MKKTTLGLFAVLVGAAGYALTKRKPETEPFLSSVQLQSLRLANAALYNSNERVRLAFDGAIKATREFESEAQTYRWSSDGRADPETRERREAQLAQKALATLLENVA